MKRVSEVKKRIPDRVGGVCERERVEEEAMSPHLRVVGGRGDGRGEGRPLMGKGGASRSIRVTAAVSALCVMSILGVVLVNWQPNLLLQQVCGGRERPHSLLVL